MGLSPQSLTIQRLRRMSMIDRRLGQVGRLAAGMALGLLLGTMGGAIATPAAAPELSSHQTASISILRPRRTIIRRSGRALIQPPEAPAPSTNTGCDILTVMANLAYTWDPYNSLSSEVAGRQLSLCRGRESDSQGVPQWGNRSPLRLGSNWYYPNGTASQFSSNFNYPNGRSATFGNSWYYPNGRNARFGSSWYTPSGRAVSEDTLLAEACEQVGTRRCINRLDEVQGAGSFWYELVLVQLAWLGYQIEQGNIDPN